MNNGQNRQNQSLLLTFKPDDRSNGKLQISDIYHTRCMTTCTVSSQECRQGTKVLNSSAERQLCDGEFQADTERAVSGRYVHSVQAVVGR